MVRPVAGLGADVALRTDPVGASVESDNGQLLLDSRFPDGIGDPTDLERALSARAGIVETGLFLGLADEAFVASADGVSHLRRPG